MCGTEGEGAPRASMRVERNASPCESPLNARACEFGIRLTEKELMQIGGNGQPQTAAVIRIIDIMEPSLAFPDEYA